MSQYSKVQSQRQLRIGELIKRIIVDEVMRGNCVYRDPNTQELITFQTPLTITEVRVSPDIQHAVVFVMPLGGDDKEKVLLQLNLIAKELRHHLAGKLQTKFIPLLKFVLDESFEYAQKIDSLLKN